MEGDDALVILQVVKHSLMPTIPLPRAAGYRLQGMP